MEGHYKKRAVRIAKKGVAPSPHVIHLGRSEPVAVLQKPAIPPRSLAVEVALESFRNDVRDRVKKNITDTTRRMVHTVVMMRRAVSGVHEKTRNVVHAVPRAAFDHVRKQLAWRERIATWMASRVTTANIRLPGSIFSLAIFAFILALLLLPFGVLPAYYQLKSSTEELLGQRQLMTALATHLRTAIMAGNFDSALTTMHLLEDQMQTAKDIIDHAGPVRYLPRVRNVHAALDSGKRAIADGTVAIEGIRRFPWSPQVFAATDTALASTQSFVTNLRRAGMHFGAEAHVNDALAIAKDGSTLTKAMLGRDARYLVIFQNENELRPTGGFMGSFAVLTLKSGAWTIEMPPQGSYALQGWLTKLVRAPEPLHLINERLEFQDVNWFPDFPTSARKIMSFYEAGGGGSVDGVVAINSSFLNDIMGLVGPVHLPEVSSTALKQGTVIEAIERAIARDRASRAPKAVLGSILDAVAGQIQKGKVPPLLAMHTALSALAEKKIQLYFREPSIQGAAMRLGFAGAMPRDWRHDYFMMTSANVAGGKTDGAIRDTVGYHVTVTEQGEMVVHVRLTRTHEGLRGDELRGIRNVSFVRFYAPHGSQFLGATGFSKAPSWRFGTPDAALVPDEDVRAVELTEKTDPASGTIIGEELRKSVFGNWLMIDPGEVKTIELTYLLPYRVARFAPTEYALYAQKQSGRTGSFHFTMSAPGFSIETPGRESVTRAGFSHKTTLATDAVERIRLVP